MSVLLERQMLFAKLLPRLLDEIYNSGYSCTLGECHRPPEMVEIYAARGSGSTSSVHPLKLAIDIHLFRNDKYLEDTLSHKPLGNYWKSLHPYTRWGGDFPRPDGNHYSIVYGKRA